MNSDALGGMGLGVFYQRGVCPEMALHLAAKRDSAGHNISEFFPILVTVVIWEQS